jgi:hypothetical protein
MMSRRVLCTSLVFFALVTCSQSFAQSPSVLYTWNGTGDVRQWFRSFGTNTITLDNNTAGELTVTETGTPGSTVAYSDDFNRIRETPVGSGGGLDLTGLSSLEFDIGHNGSGPINVQFYVQATPSSSFVALGPDLSVTPGVNTYSLPLTGLTAAQQVYIRTLGVNVRDHSGLGNVNWTVREVRSVGPGLLQRDLGTFAAGTPEGGLQGMIVNFDNAAVSGNNGGQNQTGLSNNPAGTGSVRWTDLGGGPGAAVSMGNGQAWNGNTFNNRTTDLSNYQLVVLTMSATDPNGGGGSVDVQSFFQKNNFGFQAAGIDPLPIDGQFHDLVYSLAGLTDMSVVDTTGINVAAHPQDLVINVDNIRFLVPEPASTMLLGIVGSLALMRRVRR